MAHRNFPQSVLTAITASSTELPKTLCGLYVEASGTMSYENWDGTSRSAMPVFAGANLPFTPKKITALGSGAAVSGYYDIN